MKCILYVKFLAVDNNLYRQDIDSPKTHACIIRFNSKSITINLSFVVDAFYKCIIKMYIRCTKK